MKNRTLHIIAYSLNILAWAILVFGVVASLVVGIKAATPLAKVTFLLGGFVISALNAALLLGASKLIYLFTSIEQSLEQIRDHLKK
jgi:hypothetical protein